MGFLQPLDSGQYDLIHSKSYGSDWLIFLCQNTVLLHGTVDDDLDSDPTWLSFNYTAISGSYTDVEPMMVILISETDDIKTASYRGRITEDGADATTINVNEGGATYAAGSYFWIINTFDITYRAWKPSTLDPQTAEVLVDGTITYRPPQPAILGTAAKPLRTAYVGLVDAITDKMRIAFDVSDSVVVADGATISSYQYRFKSGTYTVVSGALNTAIVTVDIDDNTEQWGEVVVTDSNGTTSTRRFYISTLPPVVGFKPTARISSTLEQGWTMSIPAFAGVDNVLDNTFAVCARTIEVFDSAEDTLYPDNNIMFVGWLQRESAQLSADSQAGVLSPTSFEFTGIMARMARLVNQPFVFEQAASATRWGQIVSLTPQKALKVFLDNFSTVTWLCQVELDYTDTTYLFPDITTQGGNFMDAIKGVAEQIVLTWEFAPDGRMGAFDDYTYLTATERLALSTIADWVAKDAIKDGITQTQEKNSSVGKINGSGAFLYTTTQQVTAYTVAAPSLAQGESQETDTLPAQILPATDTPEDALEILERRAGSKYNFVNNSLYLDVTHRPTIYGFIPSHSEFYTFTIDETVAGENGLHRIIYDTTTAWVLESVAYTRAANGKTSVKHRYHFVQAPGSKGVNTTQQPQNSVIDPLPDLGLPAFDFELPEMTFPDAGLSNLNPAQTLPPKNRVAKVDGNVMLAWASSQLFLLSNVIAQTTPTARSVTPPSLGSFLNKSAIFDPLNVALQPSLSNPSPNHYAYDLVSDGTDSKVERTADIFAPTPIWLAGASVDGLYTLLRGTNVDGGLMMYCPRKPATTVNFTYQFGGTGPASANVGDSITMTSTLFSGNIDYIFFRADKNIKITITSEVNWNPFTGAGNDRVDYTLADGTFVQHNGASGFDPTDLPAGTELAAITTPGASTFQCSQNNSVGHVTLHITINDIIGGSVVRYTDDRGTTFGSELTIGAPMATVGGFDVSRSSGVSYAACAAKVRKATSLGGAYSDFVAFTGANPVCVVIPYFRLGSNTTSQTSASDPDLIVALNAPDSGGGTLYKVTGAGVKTNITPVAGITFDNANCITVLRGTKIAVFGLVGGVYKLYVSENTGTSWTLVGTATGAKFIRDRRNDLRNAAHKGQLFLAYNTNKLAYSSTWAYNGIYPRNLSFNILGFDPLG